MQTCTLRDLVPEGADAVAETDPEVARLKSSADLVTAIEAAVGHYELPPTERMVVETPWSDVWLDPADWAEAFEAPEPGTPHNEARDEVWEALLTILVDNHDDDDAAAAAGSPVAGAERGAARGLQPRVAGARRGRRRRRPVVGARHTCGRARHGSTADEVAALQRSDARAWTVSDLPLLDAARQRIGDPEASQRRRRHEAAVAAERERYERVIDDLIAADDSELR